MIVSCVVQPKPTDDAAMPRGLRCLDDEGHLRILGKRPPHIFQAYFRFRVSAAGSLKFRYGYEYRTLAKNVVELAGGRTRTVVMIIPLSVLVCTGSTVATASVAGDVPASTVATSDGIGTDRAFSPVGAAL